jgi:predicted alpha/beta-fold hydrolase
MSTIYSWAAEHGADATGQARDFTLVYDTSTGRTKKATLGAVFGSLGPTVVRGWYGEAGVDQPTMTATALTALATATISAANSATVYCWSSSTVAKAYVKRASQIQADLETLMGKVDSTGLLSIAGV